MKTLRTLILAAPAAAALLLCLGCETAPVRTPRTTQTIVLNPDKPALEEKMETVSAIHFVLPGPDPGSGLVWILASNNVRVLEQMGPLKAVPVAPGADPQTEISFYALEPGKSMIRFFLIHPGEAESIPVQRFQILVRVED